MKNLRFIAICFVISLAIFFNVERIDFQEKNAIDLSSFVYVLGVLGILFVIALPILHRSHPLLAITLIVALYFINKVFFFTKHPLLHGMYTYISIVEISFLALLTLLAHRFARLLWEVEKIVEDIVLPDVHQRLHSLDAALKTIHLEMTLSRRHHRSMGVIVIEPGPESLATIYNRTLQEFQQMIAKRYAIASLTRVLFDVFRRTDLLIEQYEQNRLIVLCPETDDHGLAMLTQRLQKAVSDQFDIPIVCGSASFPKEAVTFEELVKKAEAAFPSPSSTQELPCVTSG